MRAASWLAVVGLLPALAWAETRPDEQGLLDRAAARERALGEQKARAEDAARKQALLTYRLARRQQLAYLGSPDGRVEQTEALDAAIVALHRAAGEAQALDAELDRVRIDRNTLAAAVDEAPAPAPTTGVRFLRPVRGAVVSQPGTRHDADTDTDLNFRGVDVLVRLNEPVRAPAAGVVRRVEPLPQGGYAVVINHADGWASILSGLRDVAVSAGSTVDGGQPLGRAGRNVDGAAVITVEFWYRRLPVDPRTVVRGLRR